jgi:(p)ppGpp synthase/HD superfamily hydrolase
MPEKILLTREVLVCLNNPDKEILRKNLHKELSFLPFTEKEIERINIAFEISFEGHRNAPARESGEAYIFHPYRAAYRMIRRQRRYRWYDSQLIIETLIHDCFEDAEKGNISPLLMKSSVQLLLGHSVAYDTFCVTKKKGEASAEYCRRLSRCEKWRPFLVKPEDRLDNMWTIGSMPRKSIISKIKETEHWFPIFEDRLNTLLERDLARGLVDDKLYFLAKNLYRELRDVTRAQKLAFDIC